MTGLLFRSAGDVVGRLRREQDRTDRELAADAGLSVETLREVESGTPPTADELDSLGQALGVSPEAIQFLAGEFPDDLHRELLENPDTALDTLRDVLEGDGERPGEEGNGLGEEGDGLGRDETIGTEPQRDSHDSKGTGVRHDPVYETELGTLYDVDCRDLLPELEPESFDLVFADPPFNLDKDYGEGSDDDRPEEAYLSWCTEWIDDIVELVKPGGSLFLYNLPKWNTHLAHYTSQYLTLRDWITVDIKFGLPIPNRLYPSHYSLLYFVRGDSPNTFDPDRLPIDTCPHCGGEQNDYGGYKSKMNPKGVNLTDVWDDIPPVRHNKHLNRDANQLSIKLLHRVVGMATEEGDRVLDPFGGAGTTYAAAELMEREWVGTELHDCAPIVERLEGGLDDDRRRLREIEQELNVLFTESALEKRVEYRDEFGFNFDDYDLSASPAPIQQSLDSY